MELIADLHLHSKYARAVSKYMELPVIAAGAAKKGIGLLATGDWTHPLWFKSIESELEEAAPGIFRLAKPADLGSAGVRFLLGTELACIYREAGRSRQVHHLVFSPSLAVCRQVIAALEARDANLDRDGRPVLALSSRELLQLLLEIDERIILIPAHIWTPWFGTYGSRTGYDSLAECFGELGRHIYAVETGLSSDPRMNWTVPELRERRILSFSDAHSAAKLGREATVFEAEPDFSYQDFWRVLAGEKGKLSLSHTLEFFPEEGKYHWSGHRTCGVRYSPAEEKVKGSICPVCGKRLTTGVEYRVLQLGGEAVLSTVVEGEEGVQMLQGPAGTLPYISLVPLLEILLEVVGGSPTKARREYDRLVAQRNEFFILLHAPARELESLGGERLAEAVLRVRRREVAVDPGYDGVFGTVRVLP